MRYCPACVTPPPCRRACVGPSRRVSQHSTTISPPTPHAAQSTRPRSPHRRSIAPRPEIPRPRHGRPYPQPQSNHSPIRPKWRLCRHTPPCPAPSATRSCDGKPRPAGLPNRNDGWIMPKPNAPQTARTAPSQPLTVRANTPARSQGLNLSRRPHLYSEMR